jgi:hypothetical protein
MVNWYRDHGPPTLPMLITPVTDLQQGYHDYGSGIGSEYAYPNAAACRPLAFTIPIRLLKPFPSDTHQCRTRRTTQLPTWTRYRPEFQIRWIPNDIPNSTLSQPTTASSSSSSSTGKVNKPPSNPSNQPIIPFPSSKPYVVPTQDVFNTFGIETCNTEPVSIKWNSGVFKSEWDGNHSTNQRIVMFDIASLIQPACKFTIPNRFFGWDSPYEPFIWRGDMIATTGDIDSKTSEKIDREARSSDVATDTIAEFEILIVRYYVESSLKQTLMDVSFEILPLVVVQLIMEYMIRNVFDYHYQGAPIHNDHLSVNIIRLPGVKRYDIPLWDISSAVAELE